jgi:eukaryotic-like serine/threonine-protein kinase
MSDPLFRRLQSALSPGYELERELTGGGMSRVFVATEQSLDRRVVIKILPPELAAGVNSERFRREIQVAARLHHPHIVPLLSAGEVDGLLYYTMPFIEGDSLRELLATRGRFSVRDVVRMMHDVVDALAHAHARGIIHRDIKPGNILTMGSHALVTDFGVAKALSAALPMSGVTTGGIAIGTPAYMAPEQLAGDPKADQRMDIYAVGLLAYELLAGSSPFSGTSPQATMAAQLTRMPEPLHTLRNDVPPDLASILDRCLQKSPDDRYASAEALLDALGCVDLGAECVVVPPAPPSRRPRRTIALAAVGILAAAAAGMAANALLSSEQDSPAPIAVDSVGSDHQRSVLLAESAQPAPQQAATLTRADSLAIARAVREQVTAELAPAPRGASELSAELASRIERMVADSMQRIMLRVEQLQVPRAPRPPVATMSRGADPPDVAVGTRYTVQAETGPARVVVAPLANATGRGDLRAFANDLTDSLRVALDRDARFVLLPGSSDGAAAGMGSHIAGGGGPVHFTVSGMLLMHEGSLSQMLQVRDAGGRVVGIIHGPLAAPDRPHSAARELAQLLASQLDELRRGGPAQTLRVVSSPSRQSGSTPGAPRTP